MNESYLFRGKDKSSGKWNCGTLYFIRGLPHIVPETFFDYWKESAAFTDSSKVIPDTVGQCTGLHDSNGTLLFEGDIVKFTYWWFDGNEAQSELIGEVIYMPEMMSYALRGVKNADWIRHIGGKEGTSDTAAFATWRFDKDDFEVIGNVHDNPKLLEVSR